MTRAARVVLTRVASAGPVLAALVIASAPGGGCTYEKVVRRESLLAGLPGAEGGLVEGEPTRPARRTDDGEQRGGSRPIREVGEDGAIRLRSASVRHVMVHTITTLEAGERELFVGQVLSEHTHRQFRERGRDPAEAFDILSGELEAIRALDGVLPLGEHSPGASMREVGDNLLLVYSAEARALGLRYRGVVVSVEGGQYRLQWFTSR